jgi:hypothetical protein
MDLSCGRHTFATVHRRNVSFFVFFSSFVFRG